MASRIVTGIDVGTYQVRVVIARTSGRPGESAPLPAIIGTGYAESKGLRHGYIVNAADVERSIRTAVTEAEKIAGAKVRNAFLSVGGIGLDEVRGRGEAVIARADAEVTELDIEKAIDASRASVEGRLMNRRILHTIPLSFTIDGTEVLGRPHGMKGTKLGVETLFVTCLSQHVESLVEAVENADIVIDDIMASPLAGSIVTLSNAEKKAGCVLANIGAETVSIVVFDNGLPVSVKVFRIGSLDITKDIALGLRISLEEAEQLKLGAITNAPYSKKKLDDILAARLADIFELIDAHLKKLGKDQLLPAGIILSGGGSGIGSIKEIAESSMKLHSKIAYLHLPLDTKIKDSSWAVAYGLTIWGASGEGRARNLGTPLMGDVGRSVTNFFKQFLP